MYQKILEEIKTVCSLLKFLIKQFEQCNYPAVPVPEDKLINVREAAQIMHVSAKSIERYRNQGILSHKKIGGLVSYSKNEVTALAKTL